MSSQGDHTNYVHVCPLMCYKQNLLKVLEICHSFPLIVPSQCPLLVLHDSLFTLLEKNMQAACQQLYILLFHLFQTQQTCLVILKMQNLQSICVFGHVHFHILNSPISYPLLQSQKMCLSDLLSIKLAIFHFNLGISLLKNLCQKQSTLKKESRKGTGHNTQPCR